VGDAIGGRALKGPTFYGLGHRSHSTSEHAAIDAVRDLFELPQGRKIMNRRTLTTMALHCSAVVFATALPQIGFAQSNQLIGTWKLNLAKSAYSPGPPPRSQTITTQAEGQGLRFTIDTIDAQGNPAKGVLAAIDDGKSYPMTGVSGYDAASFKQVNDILGHPNKRREGSPDTNQRNVCRRQDLDRYDHGCQPKRTAVLQRRRQGKAVARSSYS
jgi:hypothetical protein